MLRNVNAMKSWISLGVLAVVGAASVAADWPQWGGTDGRNMVSGEKSLPGENIGRVAFDQAGWDVLWSVRTGPYLCGNPTIADGRVFAGTGDLRWADARFAASNGGMLMCIEQRSGKMLWRLLVPRYKEKIHGSRFDDMAIGICSAATIEGKYAYVVTNRAEVLCLDVQGQADGNDGPFRDEARYMAGAGAKAPPALRRGDADIVWRFDMIEDVPSAPHDASNCNILIHKGLLYVCTSNGVHRWSDKPTPMPDAPTLIVLDKKTGRLVAVDDEKIGRRMFHGHWSSPSLTKAGGRTQILFGGGDGMVYSFEPFKAPKGKPDAPKPKPGHLKRLWFYDCNPREYRYDKDGVLIDYWAGDASDKENVVTKDYLGPSEIIGTPVAYKDRVYVATGQDPIHGEGRGILQCMDATGDGNVSKTGGIWSYKKIGRTMGTVSIADGLLYIADFAGVLHCLDADTGKVAWTHDMKERTWCSTLVADGKVYIGTERRALWIFRAGRTKKILARVKLKSRLSSMPTASNGVLYIPSNKYLHAVRKRPGAATRPATRPAAGSEGP